MAQARQLIDQVRSAGGSIEIKGQTVKALAVPADLLPALRAFKPEIVVLLMPPAKGVASTDTLKASRPIVRFTLARGAGVILGQPTDTPSGLLAALLDKWPHELRAAFNDDRQFYPMEPSQ